MDLTPHSWKRRSPKQIVAIVILILMTLALSFVEFPVVPGAEWLKYDPSGIVPLLATLLYGPLIGGIVAILAWIPHVVVDPIGAFMNIASTLSLLLVLSAVYRRDPSRKGAILGSLAGIVVTTAITICLNFVVTPLYLPATYQDVAALVLPALLPFNVIKAAVNSFVAVVSYGALERLLGEDGPTEPETRE